jgi:hypothetical protein
MFEYRSEFLRACALGEQRRTSFEKEACLEPVIKRWPGVAKDAAAQLARIFAIKIITGDGHLLASSLKLLCPAFSTAG